jgi:hypothetical protein
MSGFSADWLALREPADAAARSLPLTRAVASVLASEHELRVLDLGAGTGSNLRFLAEQLPGRQRWTLVDHDDRLLAETTQKAASWASVHGHVVSNDVNEIVIRGASLECRMSTRRVDLRTAVEDATLYEGHNLVTASALLDLVSAPWLQTLAARCAQHRVCVLFALTYDGRIECSPREPEDEAVRDLVNRHQRMDKGFGPALGPDAAATAQAYFAGVGYDVRTEQSDWVLKPESDELQRQLIDGWTEAAQAIEPERATMIQAWRERRVAHVNAHRSHLVVGHTDLAAWPTALRT